MGLRDLGPDLEDFKNRNYSGDVFHRTYDRLEQAKRACRAESEKPPYSTELERLTTK
jgi:hypothetical protein